MEAVTVPAAFAELPAHFRLGAGGGRAVTAPEAFSEVWDPEIGMDSQFVPALIMVSPDFMTLVYDLPDCYAVGFSSWNGSSGGLARNSWRMEL